MKYLNTRQSHRSATWLLVLSVCVSPLVYAQATLNQVYGVIAQINNDASQSQEQVDELVEETNELYTDYIATLKTNEGLEVYNRQLERQIAEQEKILATIEKSISEVTVIQRQVVPLMLRMVEGLDQFVQNDMPFFIQERVDRVDRLRTMMDQPNVTVSEKFSQVLRAYQIESEFGRTMDAYTDEIVIDGQSRTVDVLKVGRIALLYQTGDRSQTGMYNLETRNWDTLPDRYTIPVRNGIKMARKQLTGGLFSVPITVPGA